MTRSLSVLILLVTCWCKAEEDPKDVLNAARQLASEGKFEEALKKHIWFHDHALEIDRALYGVRLSFALGYWVELGEKFPPALTALKDIRDKKRTRLLDGEDDRELFHDVEAINSHLNDNKATVELFKKVEAERPKFAELVYDLADKALIGAGEFSLAKKYLGDPMKRLGKAKRNYDDGMRRAASKDIQSAESSRKAYEQIFTTEIVQIIAVLDNTGDRRGAQEIQAKALAILQNPAIKMALRESPKTPGD